MGKDKDIFATSLAVKKISFCMMLFNIAGCLPVLVGLVILNHRTINSKQFLLQQVLLYWFCNNILTAM